MITHIEHIAIAVKNLEKSIKHYEDNYGLKCYKVEEVKDQKVRTAFFKIWETKIELLEPIDSSGPVAKFIEKKGEGIHHIAFAVDDLKNTLMKMESGGIKLIDDKPRRGAEDLLIAFLHPKSNNGVLVELCETKNFPGTSYEWEEKV
ncbi:MAG TPA: methylmalonyl-CoA epimerase [Ignavibacteriaceae bacterium]|nr:methylmalonyl-CoA epimerase [Ignavibacteriaceae bacterium]